MMAATEPNPTEPAAGAGVRPADRVQGLQAYRRAAQADPAISLWLDANEGPALPEAALRELGLADGEAIRLYPNPARIEATLATRFGLSPERVVLTNGGDDAIDRIARATCQPGRTMLTHGPGFEMITHSARLAGADVISLPWFDQAFPEQAFLDAIDETTGLVALVTPNNPTGRTIPQAALVRIIEAARAVGAACLVDLAYAEFAESDPMPALLGYENVAIVRTFSKARGMAGLRLGVCVTSAAMADWVRVAGGPYAVSGVALRAAEWSLSAAGEAWTADVVQQVTTQRNELLARLREWGAQPLSSEANFVLARVGDPERVRVALRERGIAIRGYPGRTDLQDCLRITLPGLAADFARLLAALDDLASEGGLAR